MSRLKMIVPQNVVMNDNIYGKCATTDTWPRVVIKRTNECSFRIQIERRIVVQDNVTLYCTEFVIKNVTATCEYICAFRHSKWTKTVVVTGL